MLTMMIELVSFLHHLSLTDFHAGWECFFSDGYSEAGEEGEDSEGCTTDEEAPELILSRLKTTTTPQSLRHPSTPYKAADANNKSHLTSCIKSTMLTHDTTTPTKQTNTGSFTLNTSHKPPVLGTWTRDVRRPMGIIDGLTTHSPAPLPPVKKSRNTPYPRSPAMAAAMTSLDEILHINDLLLPPSNLTPSKFDKPIQVGAFRRGQERSSMIRENKVKGEWYTLTARSKSRNTIRKIPVLGVGSESFSHKEKRRRMKMRGRRGSSTIGGSTFGGSFDEEQESDNGEERAGLGMGPALSPLFRGMD